MADYEVRDEYKGQEGKGRVVKHLLFGVVSLTGQDDQGRAVPPERLFQRGQEIPPELLDDYNLERGERLGSFFTDEELEAIENPSAAEAGEGEAAEFSEMGESELAEYIQENRPNVHETIALAGGDPEVAARVLEAEELATDGDSRAGVVKGLNEIIEKGGK